ncbi:MAG: PEP-CTERM sorting domain-containing protein [Cyanobacteriota bacterium]
MNLRLAFSLAGLTLLTSGSLVPVRALTITPSNDGAALVNSILGEGVSLAPGSTVTYIGANGSSGFFSGGLASGIGIDSGILLTSGQALNALGPNDLPGAGTSNGTAGDPDLTGLSGVNTFDSNSISFDFISETNQVTFQYAFASEEYNEFVGTSFNDVFGFFLNGVNIATLPGTTTPVTINNVNNDANSGVYIDNTITPNPIDSQYDGFTRVLTVLADVTPGEVNTIKLAIADSGDSILDSGVFISGSTFIGEIPCSDPTDPCLPPTNDDPTDGFDFPDISIFNTDQTVWIDPEVAVGYNYFVEGGPLFASVTLPANIGNGEYNLLLDDGVGGACDNFVTPGGTITGGSAFSFASAVPCFSITGIEVEAALDPLDPTAFVTGLTFDSVGVVSLQQIPIVQNVGPQPIPEPMTLLGATVALGFGAKFKRKRDQNKG